MYDDRGRRHYLAVVLLGLCRQPSQAGHRPKEYPWPVFAVGLGLAVFGWARAWCSGLMRLPLTLRAARQIAFFTIR